METICIETYLFEELSDDVKKKVLDKTRETFEIDCDIITEGFKYQLEEKGYPTDKIAWSLGSVWPGDGMAFYGGVNTDTLASKDPKVKELVDKLRQIDPDIYISIQINKNRDLHMYDHWNTMDVEIQDDLISNEIESSKSKLFYDLIQQLEDHIKSEVQSISKELESYGYQDIEGQLSDEYLTDFLIVNEYRFTKNGNRTVIL